MNISFSPLNNQDLPLLTKWLSLPHVKEWWQPDSGDAHSKEVVEKKYASYVYGYKETTTGRKPIYAFIVSDNSEPIGYIQYYNAYDYTNELKLEHLPSSLAGLDVFIGEESLLGQSIGPQIIANFLESHVYPKFKYAIVAPKISNQRAIKSFQRAGFAIFKPWHDTVYMLARKKLVRLPVLNIIAIENTFQKFWLAEDKLWLFGSRADLKRKGGDIDLYIETNCQTAEESLTRKQKFLAELVDKIGEQKIDIVVNIIKLGTKLPIYEEAKTEGIRIL